MTSNAAPYCTSIHKLKLSAFIDVFCDGDFSGLVRSGEPTQAELLSAWQTLFDEYTEALGANDPSYRQYISVHTELARLQAKRSKIVTLATAMQEVGYVAQFAALLRGLTAKQLSFNIADPEAYQKGLNACAGVVKHLTIQIQIKEAEAAQLQGSGATAGEPMTRADFQATLVNLSDFAGYHVSDQITVGEYTTRINLFNKHIQSRKHKS